MRAQGIKKMGICILTASLLFSQMGISSQGKTDIEYRYGLGEYEGTIATDSDASPDGVDTATASDALQKPAVDEEKTVTAVRAIGFRSKTVALGTEIEEVRKLFPETLEVNSSPKVEDSEWEEVAVTWDSDHYDQDQIGTYPFEAELPDGYSWGQFTPVSANIIVSKKEMIRVKFIFDQPVMNLDYAIFSVRDFQDSSVQISTLERGREDGTDFIIVEIEDGRDYRYESRFYGYVWNELAVNPDKNEQGDGYDAVTHVTLEELPSADVLFEVSLDPENNAVVPTITVMDGMGTMPVPLTPMDGIPERYHIPVATQSPAFSWGNMIVYTVEAEGYAPVISKSFVLKEEDKGTTMVVPIALNAKKTVEEVRDRDWNASGSELEITTAGEMAQYSYLVNTRSSERVDFSNKTIRLTDDIDLSGILWEPIGDLEVVGNFDGQNHTITIAMETTSAYNGGQTAVAGVWGIIGDSKLENIKVEGSISILGSVSQGYIGGLVGYALENTEINHCSSMVDINLNSMNGSGVGGLVGASNASISGSRYEGDITVSGLNGSGQLGGLIGQQEDGSVFQSEAAGTIYVNSGVVTEGGLIGYAEGGVILACKSSMTLYAEEANAGIPGAFIGQKNGGSVLSSYASGRSSYGNDMDGVGFTTISKTGTPPVFSNSAYDETAGTQAATVGITAITEFMTPEEILEILNGSEPPMWRYDGEPVLILDPADPVLIMDLGSDEMVWEGMNIQLSVKAEVSDGGTIGYQWQRDGIDIPGAEMADYIIEDASLEDAGLYQVILINTNARGEESEPVYSELCQLLVLRFQTLRVSTGDYKGGWTNKDVIVTVSDGMLAGLDGYEYAVTPDTTAPSDGDPDWNLAQGDENNTLLMDQDVDEYYWFRAKAVDGTRGTAEGPIRVRIERTLPVIKESGIEQNSVTSSQAKIRVLAEDTGSGVDGIHYAVVTSQEPAPGIEELKEESRFVGETLSLSGLTPNTAYKAYVTAVDAAGNWSEIAVVEFTTTRRNDSSERSSNSLTASSQWILILDQWYYFDERGIMKAGWYYDPGYLSWFYLKPDGAMAVGWVQTEDGAWYYLNPTSDGRKGAMVSDAWIDTYYVGSDGAWVEGMS